jgi:hypothetical protein
MKGNLAWRLEWFFCRLWMRGGYKRGLAYRLFRTAQKARFHFAPDTAPPWSTYED